MGKVLRVFLILALPAAIAALVLEYHVFQKRQELQRRSAALKAGISRISGKLAAARDPYVEALGEPIRPEQLASSDAMAAPLATLASNAATRCDQLFRTRDTLKQTRDELTATQQELARTRQELDAARQEIAGLNEQLAQKNAQIAQARQKVNEINSQIEELSRQVSEQKEQIAQLERGKTELLEAKQRLEDALAPFLPPPIPSRDVVRNLRGQVLIADPQWNFVVLNIGKNAGVQKNTTLLVHRGDEMIGRIRISDVRDEISVGDIERDWTRGPVQPGDRVFVQ
ncbi:MAG: hypothetical protein N2652_06290 [Kiritimatiellae bacterium]|nr:hypothetical protein [Kiritimatiellia bacterium]